MRNGDLGPLHSFLIPHSSFCLTIAASDPTGGAGVQADLRTFERFGIHGLSVLTAITAQNSLGVSGVWPMSAEAIAAQLTALTMGHQFNVVKIGALCSVEAVQIVSEFLRGGNYTVVLDPVVNPTRGMQLTSNDAVRAMRDELFPLATMLTPNIPEAELLLGRKIESFEDMSEAAREMRKLGPKAILLKGGHLDSDAVRDLYFDGEEHWFESQRIDAELHGSGCTLASGIAAGLAQGKDLICSISNAREHVRELLLHSQLEFS